MIGFHNIDHFIMTEISVFNTYFSFNYSFHLSGNQIEPSNHRDENEKLLLKLYFLFFYQDFSELFGLSFSFVDLDVSFVEDVFIIALDYFGLELFLYLVLSSFFLSHLILLLFFLLLFYQRNYFLFFRS